MTLFVLGILTWTFVEYQSHRWLHNNSADHRVGHHGSPWDYQIGPSWLSIAVFMTFVGGACVSLGIPEAALGYYIGFAFYARVHYLCHHGYSGVCRCLVDPERCYNPGCPLRQPWWLQRLRLLHNIHHYHDDTKNFGVSSPLWDIVFGTYKRKP